jgi:thiol-disulfide isomerase/thioredoxin
MNRKTFIALIVLLALVAGAAGAWLSQRRQALAAQTAATAAAVEAFYRQSLPDATGVVRHMTDHRGRVVVVNFWATWCAPCVQEIPAFSKANADAAGRVTFVGLGIDSGTNIAGFNERLKPSYPLLVAGADGTALARALGDEGGELPFTVVIGPDGRVVASHLGKVDDATLQSWLAPYLAAGG